MLQEAETNIGTTNDTIHISAAAADAVKNTLVERNLEGYALRIYVTGSGCSGVQFGMALDDNIRASDQSFQAEGIRLVVDEMSIEYLRGAKIDFVHDPQHGAGFVIDSPLNVGHSCGCGSKGEGHSHAEGESCGCGDGGGNGGCGCGCGGH